MTEQFALPIHPPSEVEQLRERLGAEWTAIARARDSARNAIDRLHRGLLRNCRLALKTMPSTSALTM